MVEKVVTNPVSLTRNDCELLLAASIVYGASIQRKINGERNAEIKKLLEREMDELEAARSRLRWPA